LKNEGELCGSGAKDLPEKKGESGEKEKNETAGSKEPAVRNTAMRFCAIRRFAYSPACHCTFSHTLPLFRALT